MTIAHRRESTFSTFLNQGRQLARMAHSIHWSPCNRGTVRQTTTGAVASVIEDIVLAASSEKFSRIQNAPKLGPVVPG